INPDESLQIMTKYLSRCDIDVEIWHFDPSAKDDLYEEFKAILQNIDDDTIKKESKIRVDIVKKIRKALEDPNINSLSGLLRVKGVGDKSLEKLFIYVKNYQQNNINLFTYMDE
ncbi:MAG: Appr-1-p processing protein, partial [Campylobacterota bacterium]|nr:Appr-1-p processing protein [Campylobacterota bacterium]